QLVPHGGEGLVEREVGRVQLVGPVQRDHAHRPVVLDEDARRLRLGPGPVTGGCHHRWATRSARAVTTTLVFDRGTCGITAASTTRSPSTPMTRQSGSTTAS